MRRVGLEAWDWGDESTVVFAVVLTNDGSCILGVVLYWHGMYSECVLGAPF
jgi:hypothetical protein